MVCSVACYWDGEDRRKLPIAWRTARQVLRASKNAWFQCKGARSTESS